MSLNVHATLEAHGPGAAIEMTDEQVAELGGGRRAAVVVEIGGRSARLRLAVMAGKNLIGLSKAARTALGVDIGDEVDAVVRLDDAPRQIEVPADLAAALDAEPQVRAAFDALAPSRRTEMARSVADAKRPETRAARITAAVEQLRSPATT